MQSLKWLLAASLLPVTALCGAADLPKQGKFTAKFGWYAVGKAFEMEKDHLFWVGEFSGTVFNDAGSGFMHMASVVCPGTNDIRLDGSQGSAQGMCIVTDIEGDKAFSTWICKGPFPGPCQGEAKWYGGTGKYTGITGTNRFHGMTTVPTSSGYAVWMDGTYKLP